MDIPKETVAMYHGGTWALPPVSIAVSLPPIHSAAISPHPQPPNR